MFDYQTIRVVAEAGVHMKWGDALDPLFPLFTGLQVVAVGRRPGLGYSYRGGEYENELAFIKIGLFSCDMGGSYFLPPQVGVTTASEMMMNGRFVNAERTLAVGLVNQVVAEGAR